jgi:hypothetical protein
VFLSPKTFTNAVLTLYFQDRVFNVFLKVISSYKSNDVDKAVKSLDSTQLDVLMKYIYKGFESAIEAYSAILLIFHDKVTSSDNVSIKHWGGGGHSGKTSRHSGHFHLEKGQNWGCKKDMAPHHSIVTELLQLLRNWHIQQ